MGKGGGGKGMGDFMAGGFRNDVFGVTDEARTAQLAADEQRRAALELEKRANDYATKYNQDLQDIAKGSPAEIAAYGQQLDVAGKQLGQDERLMSAIDPALMEASKQVLSLLRGEQSGVGNALNTQRQQQRQQLVNNLRQRFGPGAETSSMGLKALQQFDSESASLGAQTQNQSLNSLMSMIQGRPTATNSQGTLSSIMGGQKSLMLGARQAGGTAALNTMINTGMNSNQSAGSEYTADMLKYGAQRKFFDEWSASSMRFGEMFGGMGAGKASGGGGGGDGGGGNTAGTSNPN